MLNAPTRSDVSVDFKILARISPGANIGASLEMQERSVGRVQRTNILAHRLVLSAVGVAD